jgi:small GTP-binding protein
MAEKATSSAAGRAPAAGQPENVRNVVLVGHSGAGKTTLVEALLAATGTIQRTGRVEDGSTVSDFDDVEIRQQRSVNLTLAPFVHNEVKVNLLDTPGYADFIGDLRAGLRAADAALFTVSAAEGIDGLTAMLWDECATAGTPRAVVITKLDHHRGDFNEALIACRAAFGESVAPLYLPVGDGQGRMRYDPVTQKYQAQFLIPLLPDASGEDAEITTSTRFNVVFWDGRDGDGHVVPSGLYMVAARFDGETKVASVAVANR